MQSFLQELLDNKFKLCNKYSENQLGESGVNIYK